MCLFFIERFLFWFWCWGRTGEAPVARATVTTLEQVAVMQDAIEHGGHRGDIARQFSPVFHRAIGVSNVLARS